MKRKVVFFRNDDVRHTLERELIELVDIFLDAKVPISLAAEPANLTEGVVDWLRDMKIKYPQYIEIIQHGYDHNKRSLYPKGTEFGTYRKFEDQYTDIQKGRQLMEEYFQGLWFPAMAFPYGSFNSHSLAALDKLKFKVMTSSVDFSRKHRIKDVIGRMLSQDSLFGKKTKQHAQLRKNYTFLEMDICVNIIKKYLSENDAIHFSFEEMIEEIERYSQYTQVVGILFHHRFHKGQFSEIKKLLDWLKKNKYDFTTLENLYCHFQKSSFQ